MGKSSPKAPAAPDPVVTAKAQTDSNIATANNNAALNRINQYTPWGSSVYSHTAGANGQPDSWSQTTSLSPEQQKLLTAQNNDSLALSRTGQGMLGTVDKTMRKPLDFSGLTKVQNNPLQSTVGDAGQLQRGVQSAGNGIQNDVNMSKVPGMVGGDQLGQAMHDAQNASYDQQTSRLDPRFANDQHDLENQLTQQGIMRNTEAWNRATDDFGRTKNDAYQTAHNNAVNNGNAAEAQLYGQGLSSNQNAYQQAMGNAQFHNSAQGQRFGQQLSSAQLNNQAQQQKFGQNLSGAQLNNQTAGQDFSQSMTQRNQGLNELMTQRQNPLNELNALRSGSQVQAPTFGATPQVNQAGTDIAGITNQNYQNQMGLYNSQVASNNSLTGALGQLGGAALMSPIGTFGMFSDIRLKENIKRVGTLDSGLPVYTYNYIGDLVPQMGVMAQEVEQIMPEAVSTHASGYKQVHYGML